MFEAQIIQERVSTITDLTNGSSRAIAPLYFAEAENENLQPEVLPHEVAYLDISATAA